jgi:hypothetical protein
MEEKKGGLLAVNGKRTEKWWVGHCFFESEFLYLLRHAKRNFYEMACSA